VGENRADGRKNRLAVANGEAGGEDEGGAAGEAAGEAAGDAGGEDEGKDDWVSVGEKLAVGHGVPTQSEALFIRTRWLAVALTVLPLTDACDADGTESENTQFSTANFATESAW
jgi:hypothetical protein